MSTLPVNARVLLEKLIDCGWHLAMSPGRDTGGAHYITIEGQADRSKVKCTWHTRETGTYRLFTCMASTPDSPRWHDTTLKKVMAIVEGQR